MVKRARASEQASSISEISIHCTVYCTEHMNSIALLTSPGYDFSVSPETDKPECTHGRKMGLERIRQGKKNI